MKKIQILFLLLFAGLLARAQQKPDYERTRTNQVLSDRAIKARDVLIIPHGDSASVPGYVPDSNRTAWLYYKIAPGDTVLMVGGKRVSGDTTSLSHRIDLKIPLLQKGAANGVATLDINNKIPLSEIPSALLGAVNYQGNYNALTDSPSLPTPSMGNKGYYWVVDTAGTQHGLTLKNGDWIISNGVVYQKVDNNNSILSVFGRVGAIIAQTGDYNTDLVTEGTNKYYTDARVQAFGDPRYVLKGGDTMNGNLTIQDYNLIVHNVGHGASVIDGGLNVGALGSTGRVSAADFYTSSNYTRISDTEAQLSQIRLLNKTTLADPNVLVLNHSAFTASRTQTFQDKDGAIALTSDIPGISGTANLVARFTGTNTLGTGVLNDDATVAAARGTTAGIAGFIITNPGTSTGYVNGAALQFNYASGLTTSALRIARIVAAPQTGGGGDLYFDTAPSSTGAWSTKMVVLQNGNVGIGTTSPANLLHVLTAGATAATFERAGATNISVEFKNGSGSFFVGKSQTTGNFNLATSASLSTNPFVSITPTGSVGINTQAANAKLEVLNTTEQIRPSYDATHYASFTVNSSGNLTIAPTGGNLNVTGALLVSRNVADANTAFIINQGNVGATGNIEQWQFNGSEVAHLEKDGTFVSNANIHASGNIEVSSHVEGNQFILTALNTAPASSSDTGTTGEIKVTAGYIYVCVATNTWVRTALSTF